VLFDAVGTLIRPSPSVSVAYAEAASRQGVELDRSMIQRRFDLHFGADNADAGSDKLRTDEATERGRWRRVVENVLPEVPDPNRAFDELWDHFGRPQSWCVFDDVTVALERSAAAGVRIAIASNFDGRLRQVARGLPELARLLDTIVISSEAGFRKPHRDFYVAACQKLGLPPEHVISVGDDRENDVLGAQRAGLRAFLLDRAARESDDPNAFRDLISLLDHVLRAKSPSTSAE
jgi:putative hydrolase of the HAD superfamily